MANLAADAAAAAPGTRTPGPQQRTLWAFLTYADRRQWRTRGVPAHGSRYRSAVTSVSRPKNGAPITPPASTATKSRRRKASGSSGRSDGKGGAAVRALKKRRLVLDSDDEPTAVTPPPDTPAEPLEAPSPADAPPPAAALETAEEAATDGGATGPSEEAAPDATPPSAQHGGTAEDGGEAVPQLGLGLRKWRRTGRLVQQRLRPEPTALDRPWKPAASAPTSAGRSSSNGTVGAPSRTTSPTSATAAGADDADGTEAGRGQLFLNLGQKHFGYYTCPACRMVYVRGRPEDDDLHRRYHRTLLQGIHVDHVPPSVRVVTELDGAGVLVLTDDSPKPILRKVGRAKARRGARRSHVLSARACGPRRAPFAHRAWSCCRWSTCTSAPCRGPICPPWGGGRYADDDPLSAASIASADASARARTPRLHLARSSTCTARRRGSWPRARWPSRCCRRGSWSTARRSRARRTCRGRPRRAASAAYGCARSTGARAWPRSCWTPCGTRTAAHVVGARRAR